ncbi:MULTISPECIES: DUF2490 domain-containing protein [Flavobacterium]|uniref:DUF2490 domain-containing protein n=1 Tax=Flavobacterium hankyongi TaxID=1176532 RepID=A0ABP9A611_9FLAO|nr:DUF2490 domain-containing protein [Flavobacterium sp. N1846]
MKKIIFILILSLFYNLQSNAQNDEHLSGFSSLSLTYKFNKKWYGYVELQERSIADFSKIDYYEVKGGMGYNINGSNQAFIGLGRYANYKDSRLSREELRFWLQYTFSKNISRVKFEQRVRLEKRLFHNPVTDANTNTERYRYRLNLIVPINKEKVEAKTIFLNTYDELFIGPEKPTINRNRMYLGGGYQFTKSFGVSLGYLFQREFGATANSNFHFLFCGLNFTIDGSKSDIPVQAPSPDHD